MRTCKYIAAGLVVVLGGLAVRAADLELDPNEVSTLFPELKDAAPPDWVKPGVQLGYYYATATVRGSYHNYSRDEKGDWVDAQGNRYAQSDTPTGSAHGFLVSSVLAMEKNAVIGMNNFSMFTPTGPLSAVSGIGAITSGGGNEVWLGPEARKKMLALNTPEIKALRGPFTYNKQKYDAIYVSAKSNSSSHYWIYDEKTGILLRGGSASSGAAPGIAGANEVAGASTILTLTSFAGMRTLDLPWSKGDAPQWVGTFKGLSYKGAMTVAVPGSGSSAFPVEVTAAPKRRGAGWVETVVTLTQKNGLGLPPLTSESTLISSSRSLMGLFVPPTSLGELKEGQVLDRDPVTGFTYSVAGIVQAPGGRSVVVIREAGQAHATECGYDRESGLLTTYSKLDRSAPPGMTQLQVQLVGQE
jgi:hypothetical protein